MRVNQGLAILAVMLCCGAAEAHESDVMCTNPTSGASWRIHIDYDKHLVDGVAARISDAEISWRDAGGSKYTIDRKSGDMTQITASSTGGYFLYDHCKIN